MCVLCHDNQQEHVNQREAAWLVKPVKLFVSCIKNAPPPPPLAKHLHSRLATPLGVVLTMSTLSQCRKHARSLVQMSCLAQWRLANTQFVDCFSLFIAAFSVFVSKPGSPALWEREQCWNEQLNRACLEQS